MSNYVNVRIPVWWTPFYAIIFLMILAGVGTGLLNIPLLTKNLWIIIPSALLALVILGFALYVCVFMLYHLSKSAPSPDKADK